MKRATRSEASGDRSHGPTDPTSTSKKGQKGYTSSKGGLEGDGCEISNHHPMNSLIIKLGATRDVVRTTPLLRRFDGPVSWITAKNNLELLQGVDPEVRCVSWENRKLVADTAYDLVINLEDHCEVSQFLDELTFKQLFGAYLDGDDRLAYTLDSRDWFDL